MKHGQASVKYSDKSTYVGEFVNDKKEGKGVYTTHEGRKHDGLWAGGMKNGQGKQIAADGGIEKEGVWEDNKFLPKK